MVMSMIMVTVMVIVMVVVLGHYEGLHHGHCYRYFFLPFPLGYIIIPKSFLMTYLFPASWYLYFFNFAQVVFSIDKVGNPLDTNQKEMEKCYY